MHKLNKIEQLPEGFVWHCSCGHEGKPNGIKERSRQGWLRHDLKERTKFREQVLVGTVQHSHS